MAQLKDSMVTGNLRVTDTTYTDTVQVDIIKTHTASDTSAVGPGTDGQILKTNGTRSYWGDVNLDDVADGSTRKLSDYAPINSPELTGTPTAPTATAGTNNTQIATTEFVTNAVNTAAGSVYRVKGTKADYASLPSSGNVAGDVWNVTVAYGNYPAGTNWVWTGNEWDALGGEIDLSSKQDVLTFDTIPTENSTNPVTSGGIYNAITENEQVTAAALNDLKNKTQAIESDIATIDKVTASSLNDLNDRMLEAEGTLSNTQKVFVGYRTDENSDPRNLSYKTKFPAEEGSILNIGNPEYTEGTTKEISNMYTPTWPNSTNNFLVWSGGVSDGVASILFTEPGTYYFFNDNPEYIDSSFNSYTDAATFSFTISSDDLYYATETQEESSDGTFTTRQANLGWEGKLYLYYSGTKPNIKVACFSDPNQYIMHNGRWEVYHFPKDGVVGPYDFKSNNGRYKSSDFVTGEEVWSSIHPLVLSSVYGKIEPFRPYFLGTITGNHTWSLADATFMETNDRPYNAFAANHYFWTFDTGATAPTITWPSGLTWPGGSPPAILPNKHYEISVLNNIVAWMEV